MRVRIDASGVAPGTYQADLLFVTDDRRARVQRVPVAVHVTGP